MKYDKDKIKQDLTIEQVFDLVAELGGEPQMRNNYFVSQTICHNYVGEGSYKLYYYDNTKLFRCYTDCGTSFDIYELICKVKTIREEFKISYDENNKIKNQPWELFDALNFVIDFFNLRAYYSSEESNEELVNDNLKSDWSKIHQYEKNNSLELKKQIVDLKLFDPNTLNNFPVLHILPWEAEGIKHQVIKNKGIVFNPISQGVVIPHFDIDNNLVGIRERTMIKENEVYGKYRPAFFNNQLYNHPLSFNLYNLNSSKYNIKLLKKVIVFEGEKSCLKYASFFGEDNDISVATCGSNLIEYQFKLLKNLGVEEIIIAFDKQFQKIGDDEYKRWIKKLQQMANKYRQFCTISFMFDTKDSLNYKDAPIDQGKEIFLELFKNRLNADGGLQ